MALALKNLKSVDMPLNKKQKKKKKKKKKKLVDQFIFFGSNISSTKSKVNIEKA